MSITGCTERTARKMYQCRRCRYTFRVPKVVKINGYTHMECCPNCLSTDFDEAYRCEHCGEYFFEDELEDWWCEECRTTTFERFENLVVCNFTTDELNHIMERWEIPSAENPIPDRQ